MADVNEKKTGDGVETTQQAIKKTGEGAAPAKPAGGRTGETAEAPRKKKITAVFRTQNSTQNSLKSRPAGTAVRKKPAAPGTEKVPLRQAKPAAEKSGEGAAVKPAVKPVEGKEAPRTNPVKPAAETAPVQKAEPAAQSKPEGIAPEPVKQEEVRPAPRFVDMNKVREAEKPIVRRPAGQRTAGQRGEGRPGGTQGQRGGFQGQRSGAPGQRSGFQGQRGGGPGQKGGFQNQFRGGFPDKDKDQPTGHQSGPRNPGQKPQGGGDFGGMGMSKPGAKNAKNRTVNQGNRFDKKNSDELRRPGVKVPGKDLQRPLKPVKKEVEEPQIKLITIPETLTIKDLADAMKIQPAAIIKKLFLSGKIVTLNTEIDYETAEEIAVEYDVLCEKEVQVDVIEEMLKDTTEDPEDSLEERPPVVCVMGHVDHGKTSLLDAIRKTNVTSREAGGITQAIGAYMVEINGRKITFLDTPGHEAFTAMRMRGAQATDIAILVVAADDGVMPQTVEAINHAKAAGVDIVVAINKIDKPGANPDRVKQELTEYGLISEEWGGSTTMVPISAKTGEGIEDLLEMVLLTSDVKELKANPNRNARGLVIEAQLDKGRGPVATVLVQKGTLHVGDTVAAGCSYGKIRAMVDDKGRRVKTAVPSTPVEILGLNDVPNAGEIFVATDNEKDARSYAETFISEGRKKLLSETKSKVSLDDIFAQIKEGELKELDLIVKADVQGSVEAVKTSLLKLSNDEVVVKVIHSGAGNINESDVSLASASNAIIIGFNVKVDPTAKSTADQEKVDIRLYDIIYKAIEDVELAMKGMLDPVFEEHVIGHAVVRQTFKASSVGTIAGSFVLDGKLIRGCKCRITRDGETLFDGPLASLKRFKDDVKEVREGFECGLVFEKFNNLQEDDAIEAYEMVEVAR